MHITIAITLCYDLMLSQNAFILSRIVITKEIYSKIKGKVFANGWSRKFLLKLQFEELRALLLRVIALQQ